MGALRTRMIEEMKLRNFSPRTQESYLGAMIGLVKHYRRSPDQLTQEEIRAYLLHLQERGLAKGSSPLLALISGKPHSSFAVPAGSRLSCWLPTSVWFCSDRF